jgi:hypothetical protein
MKYYYCYLWVLLLTVSTSTFGANFDMISDLGTSAYTIANGRVQGLSNASYAIFENPAAIQPEKKLTAAVFGVRLLQEVDYSALSVAYKLPIGSIGLGYMSASVADIPRTEDNGVTIVRIGSFNYKNDLIKIGYQLNVMPQVSVGVSSQYYLSQFEDVNGIGSNMDFGLYWTLSPYTHVSLFQKNIIPGKKVIFNDSEKEYLAQESYLSVQTRIKNLQPSLQLKYKDKLTSISGGLTLITPSPYLFISGGIHTDYVVGKLSQTNSIGVTLLLGTFEWNYAFEQSDYISSPNQHYISMSISI